MHTEQQQACMLAEHVFADAYYRDLEEAHNKKILEVVKKDLNNERYQQYQSTGFCKYYTHILDMAEGCYAIADLAVKAGDMEFAEMLWNLSKHWVNAFDKETGLLSDKSWYYEGNKWNYSFRLLQNMQQRIELAGGKEKFVELLDSFFGYDKEPAIQVRTENDSREVEKRQLDRFEGFNNEPDMETPYAYIYTDRHDRTCEIVRMGTKYMFTKGRGGIPGNNDSGGLSSCYIWNVIGIFPVSGQNLMLIGSPSVDETVLKLSNGKEFRITAINNSDKNIYVEKIIFNGVHMIEHSFKTSEMMKGGSLTLYMTDKK